MFLILTPYPTDMTTLDFSLKFLLYYVRLSYSLLSMWILTIIPVLKSLDLWSDDFHFLFCSVSFHFRYYISSISCSCSLCNSKCECLSILESSKRVSGRCMVKQVHWSSLIFVLYSLFTIGFFLLLLSLVIVIYFMFDFTEMLKTKGMVWLRFSFSSFKSTVMSPIT